MKILGNIKQYKINNVTYAYLKSIWTVCDLNKLGAIHDFHLSENPFCCNPVYAILSLGILHYEGV